MSVAIWIGRNRSADGCAYLAGYGDEPSSHWLRIVDEPGSARHACVEYSYFLGVPGTLTNGGVNVHGVAVRDVWSTSRDELRAETPADRHGPTYSDLARAVLARARTAREGAALIGAMVDDSGDTSYGGNSHLVADADEAWVCIQFAGGRRLWCAERLGPDDIRVSRPGWIGRLEPADVASGRAMCSSNFFPLARDRGWAADDGFDVNATYGDGKGRWAGAAWLEERLGALPKVGLHDLMALLRSPRITGDTAGYGQVVPLPAGDVDPIVRQLWHAPIGPVAAPFLPVWLGVSSVPEEYRRHRYLTVGESHRFVDPRRSVAGDDDSLSTVPQGVESTRSAVASFKRLLYLVLADHGRLLDEVARAWGARESELAALAGATTRAAELLLGAGRRDDAVLLLTSVARSEMLRALDDAEHLAAAWEILVRRDGLIGEGGFRGPDQIW